MTCPFCNQPVFQCPETGEQVHVNTNEVGCDEERLAYWDSSKLHKELGR